MSKLQNVKAIQEMMAGTHKTQTKKTFAMGSSKKEVTEKDIIEKFENGKPKIWIETDPKGFRIKVTQHAGFKSREPENSVRDQVREILQVPDECPKCGTEMRNHEKRLNFKFWFLRKQCFGCTLSEERRIKSQGEEAWKKYENEIMSKNAESWFKDADKEVETLKKEVEQTVWGNADGEIETVDTTAFVDKMEQDYEKLKNDIRSKFTG